MECIPPQAVLSGKRLGGCGGWRKVIVGVNSEVKKMAKRGGNIAFMASNEIVNASPSSSSIQSLAIKDFVGKEQVKYIKKKYPRIFEPEMLPFDGS